MNKVYRCWANSVPGIFRCWSGLVGGNYNSWSTDRTITNVRCCCTSRSSFRVKNSSGGGGWVVDGWRWFIHHRVFYQLGRGCVDVCRDESIITSPPCTFTCPLESRYLQSAGDEFVSCQLNTHTHTLGLLRNLNLLFIQSSLLLHFPSSINSSSSQATRIWQSGFVYFNTNYYPFLYPLPLDLRVLSSLHLFFDINTFLIDLSNTFVGSS